MNSTLIRLISRCLIVSLAILPLQAKAGLVGTDAVIATPAERELLRDFVARPDVAGKLQVLGVPAAEAQKRVAALTEAEAAQLAKRIQDLPAGADPTGVGIVLVIALVAWRLWVDAQDKEAAAGKKSTPAPKPAPKPAAQ
jgi:hypothetical protein